MIYQKPRPIFDVPFRERSHSKIDGEIKVTVAVLSAEESRQLFRKQDENYKKYDSKQD